EPLARSFIQAFSESSRRAAPRLSKDALRMLRAYPWPGNVRELRNVIERALVLCTGNEITAKDLPAGRLHTAFEARPWPPARQRAPTIPLQPLPPDAWEQTTKPSVAWPEPDTKGPEYARVVAALEECGGNQTHAAKKLGVSRRTLVTWIEKFG